MDIVSSKARGVRPRIVVEDASASCARFLFLAAAFSIVECGIEASPLGAFRLLRDFHVGSKVKVMFVFVFVFVFVYAFSIQHSGICRALPMIQPKNNIFITTTSQTRLNFFRSTKGVEGRVFGVCLEWGGEVGAIRRPWANFVFQCRLWPNLCLQNTLEDAKTSGCPSNHWT